MANNTIELKARSFLSCTLITGGKCLYLNIGRLVEFSRSGSASRLRLLNWVPYKRVGEVSCLEVFGKCIYKRVGAARRLFGVALPLWPR